MKGIDAKSFAVIISEVLFVENNYFSKSDQQIAEALGCSFGHVRFLRRLIDRIKAVVAKTTVRTKREEYVLANWQTQSDEEMAKHLHLQSSSILRFRLSLGLNRSALRNPQLRLILKEDLERMIFQEGKSYVQIGQDCGVSRERIRQIAKGYGINTRQPVEWQLDKQVLKQGLEEAGSIKEFAHKHKVPETSVRYRIKKFKLHFRQGTKTVKLVCAFCGREFIRPKRLVRNKKQFFCDRICLGRNLVKVRWPNRSQSPILKKEELERMALKEGMTFAQIAKTCEVPKYQIYQIAKKYGIRKRQSQDWQLNKQVFQQGLEKSGSVKNFAQLHKVNKSKVYYWAAKFNLQLEDIWQKKT